MDRGEKPAENRAAGWEGFTTEGVDAYPVSCTHQDIVKSPYVEIVAEKLKKCLETASDHV